MPKDASEADLRPLFEIFGEIVCLNVLRTQRGQGPSAGAEAPPPDRDPVPEHYLVPAPLHRTTCLQSTAICCGQARGGPT